MRKRIWGMFIAFTMLCAVLPCIARADGIEIGEYVKMGTYYDKPILWRCVDIDENGPLMLSDKIICIKPFDARNSANTSTGSHSRAGRTLWGSNYWADSNMRSWLNSDSGAGEVEWLCGNPPDSAHVSYNAYDEESGFLTNFSRKELYAVKEVEQKSLLSTIDNDVATTGTEKYEFTPDITYAVSNYNTAFAEYVTDKMFLLDVKQINAVYNNGDILGEDYYIGVPTAQCVANSEYKVRIEAGKEWAYFLRSPYPDENYSTILVNESGVSSYASSVNLGDVGVRPAFYLNSPVVILYSGSGTASEPYIPVTQAYLSITSSGEEYELTADTDYKGDCTAYAATYNAEGALLSVTTAPFTDGAAKIIPDTSSPSAASIKFFVWTNTIQPVTFAKTIDLYMHISLPLSEGGIFLF